MIIRIFVLLSFVLVGAAHADSFDVQIGAFRNPDVTRIVLPDNVGELRGTTGPGGLTRFVVGPFEGRAAAGRARDQLRAAGFPGAFIRTTQDGRAEARERATSVRTAPVADTATDLGAGEASSSASQQDLLKLMNLSDEERRDLVYLDGKLHRKVGDKFVPLDD